MSHASVDEDVWRRYWSTGRLAACLDRQAPNYRGPIHREWYEFFSALRSRSVVLDVATGNGAIAAIAAAVSRDQQRDFTINGIDSADIDPPRFAGHLLGDLSGVSFHPKTYAERLPFDSASIDAVCGQYALEYTDVDRSIPELLRVLRSSGSFRFVVHSRQGVVWEATCRQLKQARIIESRSGLFETLRQLIDAERAGKTSAKQSRPRKAKFQALARRIASDARTGGDPELVNNVLATVAEIYEYRRQTGLEETMHQLDLAERDLADHAARLQALSDAAMDQREVENLASMMEAAGGTRLETRIVLDSREVQVGWCLLGEKGSS